MQQERDRYTKKGLITFGVNITHKLNKKTGEYKKDGGYRGGWQKSTLTNSVFKKNDTGLAIPTGKIGGIFVIDIDNEDDWNQLLKYEKKTEPNTVKAKSAKGYHLYFQWEDKLEPIKNNTQSFGEKYSIDVRTNGGNIFVPPSSYYNIQTGEQFTYEWIVSIFDEKLKKLPPWLRKLLLAQNTVKKAEKKTLKKNTETEPKNKVTELKNIENTEKKEGNYLTFGYNDCNELIDMLDDRRCSNYSDWLDIGMCLYNINKNYLGIWDKWSSNDPKYEDSKCEKKWNSFKNDKNGLKIGSLRSWCKNDNVDKYNNFIGIKRREQMVSAKYPDKKLIFDEHIINGQMCTIPLRNDTCFIKNQKHENMSDSMYISITDKFMCIKCLHRDCLGKSYPCPQIVMNNIEVNQVNNYFITNIINTSDEMIDFKKVNIFESPKMNQLVYNGLQFKHFEMAEILFHIYENDYMYAENNEWYMFTGNRWKGLGKMNTRLRTSITVKLKEIYQKLLKDLVEKNEDINMIKSIKKIINGVSETLVKNNIITELIDLYSDNKNPDRDFLEKIDINFNLLAFNNGVYDFDKMVFRDTQPDDYVSMTVGYDFSTTYSENKDGLLKFLEDVLPIAEDREYLLQYLGDSITGNIHQLFTILTGDGSNGKSQLVKLIKDTFGNYYSAVPSPFFTRKEQDASTPDPCLLNLRYMRFVFGSEPPRKETLNTSNIKFLTGGDSKGLRTLFSVKSVDFAPNFALFLLCNDIPETDGYIDNAFARRLRCIHFPTKFVEKPTQPHERQIDEEINKKFKNWRQDFVLLLIEYYKKKLNGTKLTAPKNVTKWTDKYKKDVDIYAQFKDEYLIKTENDKDRLTFKEIYKVFKGWYADTKTKKDVPTDKDFGKGMKEKFESCSIKGKTQYGIKGYKFYEEEEE